jgi:pimeloyl-ACP methyl ester carboxylesterase
MTPYSSLPNLVVSAPNGVEYTYRDTGNGELPLVVLQHFRGNLDSWDPALIDDLAATRRVLAFDNAGVGGSSGTTPHDIEQMAHDAIAFIAGMGFTQADILGYSIGSFIAQEIALIRPDLVRNLILASAAPKGAAGMHGWAPEVIGAVGKPETSPEDYLRVFFTPSTASRKHWGACTPGPKIAIIARAGLPARRSTTRSAAGESPITRPCSGWLPSERPYSWRTATVTR